MKHLYQSLVWMDYWPENRRQRLIFIVLIYIPPLGAQLFAPKWLTKCKKKKPDKNSKTIKTSFLIPSIWNMVKTNTLKMWEGSSMHNSKPTWKALPSHSFKMPLKSEPGRAPLGRAFHRRGAATKKALPLGPTIWASLDGRTLQRASSHGSGSIRGDSPADSQVSNCIRSKPAPQVGHRRLSRASPTPILQDWCDLIYWLPSENVLLGSELHVASVPYRPYGA